LLGELLEATRGRGGVPVPSTSLSPAPLQVVAGDIAPLATSASPEPTVDAPEPLDVPLAGGLAKATRE